MSTALRCACCRRYGDEIARDDPDYVFFPIETLCLCTGCLKMYRRWRKARRKWYRLWLATETKTAPRICRYLDEVRTKTWMPPKGSAHERLAKLARNE